MLMLPETGASSRPRELGSELPKSERADVAPSCCLRGKRVVIAEDQGVTQLHLRRILESKGMDVVGTAANGRDAIEVVLRTRPSLVLMDVQMPVMDGLEASRYILDLFRVCIVMLTAYTEIKHQEEALLIGAVGYVIKPVTAATLVPQLDAALRKFLSNNDQAS